MCTTRCLHWKLYDNFPIQNGNKEELYSSSFQINDKVVTNALKKMRI